MQSGCHMYVVIFGSEFESKRWGADTVANGGAAFRAFYRWKCDVPHRLDGLTNAYCLRFTIDI